MAKSTYTLVRRLILPLLCSRDTCRSPRRGSFICQFKVSGQLDGCPPQTIHHTLVVGRHKTNARKSRPQYKPDTTYVTGGTVSRPRKDNSFVSFPKRPLEAGRRCPGGKLHINARTAAGGVVQVTIREGEGVRDGEWPAEWSLDGATDFIAGCVLVTARPGTDRGV